MARTRRGQRRNCLVPTRPIVSQFVDDPEIATILGDFVGRLADQVGRDARGAWRPAGTKSFSAPAHRLKGAGGSYGYPSLTDACKLLEDAAKAGDNAAAGAALEAVAALSARPFKSVIGRQALAGRTSA